MMNPAQALNYWVCESGPDGPNRLAGAFPTEDDAGVYATVKSMTTGVYQVWRCNHETRADLIRTYHQGRVVK